MYWLLSHSLAMRKEIAFLKEENQYFMDSFRNIRTPITLLHTPLKSTYSNNCPDIIKKDLSLAIRNIDCLNISRNREIYKEYNRSYRIFKKSYYTRIFMQ